MIEQTESAPPSRRRRRRWGLRLLTVVALVLVLPGVALFARLSVAPIHLPEMLQARMVDQMDAAMRANSLTVGDIVLSLPERGRAPALEFRDVALIDPDGATRAALPVLRLRIRARPLLNRAVLVSGITVIGAELNLARDAAGRYDLSFARTDAPPESVDLAESLARLDAMFAAPAFSQMDDVRGEGLAVTLTDAMTGQVIRVRQAEMRLARDGDRLEMDLSGNILGSRDASLSVALARVASRGETEIGLQFSNLAARDLATATPALGWLDLMRAPIDGALSALLSDDGTLGDLTGGLSIGTGHLRLSQGAEPLGFDAMDATIAYDATSRRVLFERVSLRAPDLAFTASGHADVSEDADVFTGQFDLTGITAAPPGFFAAPLAIDGAALDLRLTLREEVAIDLGQAVIFDDDLRILARGHALAGPEGLSLSVDASIPEATLDQILTLWPLEAIVNTRSWIATRLSMGRVTGADFALRRAPGQDVRKELSFDFHDTTVLALPAAPPIIGAGGYLSLIDNRLVLRLDEGQIAADGHGPVDLAGSRVVIDDIRPRGPDARFDVDMAGDLRDLLEVLNGAPLNVLAESDLLPGDLGTGQVRASATIITRLLDRDPDEGLAGLAVNAVGEVTGYRGEDLVPGRVLTAQRMAIEVSPDSLVISGRAAIDGVPLTGQWSTEIGPDAAPGSRVEARVQIDRTALARFGMALPDWMISGQGAADVTVLLGRDRSPGLTLRSDLAGLRLAIPALGWQLGADQTGDLAVEMRLGPDPEVTRLSLDGGGLRLTGAVTIGADGTLERLSASEFRLGSWLDVQGALIGRGGQPPAIEVSGGTLDMRTMPSLAGGGGGADEAGPLSIALDRLQITAGIALTGLRADLSVAGGLQGQFRGEVNGAAPVSGSLVAGANGTSVRLASDDGGAVMRAAGVFDNAYGGPLDLILQARPEPGQYDGQLTVDGPRLRDAPVMAELLNAVSVVGLLDQLGGEGINLGQVEARFLLTPDRIALTEGTALGPSMGISMDGVYDVQSQRFEMQGVISPFYLVNGIFGALFAPRREGLFGFSYRLTGTQGETSVSVNPLSILTPGIFREIFRAPPPDFSQGSGG